MLTHHLLQHFVDLGILLLKNARRFEEVLREHGEVFGLVSVGVRIDEYFAQSRVFPAVEPEDRNDRAGGDQNASGFIDVGADTVAIAAAAARR